jgi:hypothetical protein
MKSMQQSRRPDRSGRRIAGRAQQDHILDPYQAQHKLKEPTACPKCGAVYHHGRWQWGQKPDGAHEQPCPACRRIENALPAGILTLHGDFARQHKDELTGLARHEEAAEKGEHPLNRIIAIADTPEGLAITTTDIHLPRRLGEAIERAFHGTLTMHFDDAAYFVRIDWQPPS